MKFPRLLPFVFFFSSCGAGSDPTFVSVAVDSSRNELGFLPAQAEKGSLFQYY